MDTIVELKVCTNMTDQDARLACFDELGQSVVGEEAADSSPAQEEKVQTEAATEAETTAAPLPDELGSSNDVQYVGLITSCQKGQYGRWFFIFDNEQVRKATNNRNLRFKECHFNATITR